MFCLGAFVKDIVEHDNYNTEGVKANRVVSAIE